MMKIIMEPLVGIGNVKIGMERNEIRTTINKSVVEFKKSKFSKNTTDDFGFCHIFYDTNNKCNAIEVFDEVELVFEGKNIFEIKVTELKELFEDISEEYGTYISKEKSLGFSIDDNKIVTVLIGCKNYYD